MKRQTIGQHRLAEAEKLLKRYAKLVSAFTHCSGKVLKRPNGDISCDCLQCHTDQFLSERVKPDAQAFRVHQPSWLTEQIQIR